MNKSASNQGNHWDTKSVQSIDKYEIHYSDDKRFNENCCDRSIHLIYIMKKKYGTKCIMRQQQIILMTVVMFMFLIFIAAGGYYYTTTLEEETEKKTGSCSGTDANGVYEYDDDGNCVFKECKSGFALEGGYCIIQRDYTADMDAGNIPVNCEIGGYVEGPCVDEFGRQLTGETGRCGTGMKTFTADPSAFSLANSLGECENYTYKESCEVPCKTLDCNATDDNYTKTDGVCRGFDGNPIGGDTNRCGSGYQIFEVDPATAGNFESDELRDAWVAENLKDCTPLKKTCNVICEPGMESSGCPELTTDTGAAYVEDRNGDKACIPKEIAVSLLKGETRYDRYNMPMEKLTRGRAKELEITSMNQLPSGYSILYKSDVVDFADYTLKGCATAKLETCTQPTVSDDCVLRADVTQVCYPTACGKQHKKKVEYVIDKHAWGSGACDMSKLGPDTVECTEERSPDCCSSDNEIHWVTDTSATCESDGRRLMRQNNCSMLGLNPEPTKYENCCYKSDWNYEGCNLDGRGGKDKYTRSVVNCDSDVTRVKYESNVACDAIYGVRRMHVNALGENGRVGMIVYFDNSDSDRRVLNAYSSGEEQDLSFTQDRTVTAISGDVSAGGSGQAWGHMYLYDVNDNLLFSASTPGAWGHHSAAEEFRFHTNKPGHEAPDWE